MTNAPLARPEQGSTAVTPAEEPTIGKLVADASRDISTLIQQEIALAKSEIKVSARYGGVAIGLFAGAAFLLLLAVIMLSVAFAYLINLTGLDLAWCFLIVFLAYTLIAALLGFIGYKKVQRVRPPERAMAQGQEIARTLSRKG